VSASTTAPPPYSYAQTFALHSLPGSSKVMHLDFGQPAVKHTASRALSIAAH
jgi:hypothetical protein